MVKSPGSEQPQGRWGSVLGLEAWRCAELCWEPAGDVPELGPHLWPHIVPIRDAGKDSYGKTSASALAKCIPNSEKAPFSITLSFCKMISESESHSEGFGLLTRLEGMGDSGSGLALTCSILGESTVESSVQCMPELEVARALVEASRPVRRNASVCAVLAGKNINPELTGDTDECMPKVCKSVSRVCSGGKRLLSEMQSLAALWVTETLPACPANSDAQLPTQALFCHSSIPLGKTLVSLLPEMRTSLGWREPCREPGAQLYRALERLRRMQCQCSSRLAAMDPIAWLNPACCVGGSPQHYLAY